MMRFAAVAALLFALFFGASLAYARLGDTHSAGGQITAGHDFPTEAPTPDSSRTPDPSSTPGPPTEPPPTPPGGPTYVSYLALDAVPESAPANEATSYGSVESCRSVQPGDRFDVDIVLDANVPARGIFSIMFYLKFDPALLRVSNVNYELLLATTGGSVFGLGEGDPDKDGDFLNAGVVFNADGPRSGGTIARITLEALAPGTSDLLLHDVDVTDFETYINGPDTNSSLAKVEIGSSCATPGPSRTPSTVLPTATETDTTSATVTPTFTPTPTPTPTSTLLPHTATPKPSPEPTVAAATFTPTATPLPPREPGDADCDGNVDEADAINILLGIGFGAPQSPCQTASNHSTGDYDCSGAVDSLDVLALLMQFAGLPPPTSC